MCIKATQVPDEDTIKPDTAIDEVTDTDTGPIDVEVPESEMVDIPAGEFMMGCNEAVDTECEEDEYPYHAVMLSAYKIDKYEVTAGEYKKCVDAGVCNNNNKEEFQYGMYPDCPLGVAGKENYAMDCTSWYGAKTYCEWVGKRLPTEAEWEKAARGTDGRKYPWGNEPGVSCDYAIIFDAGDVAGGCGTYDLWPVGSKENGKSPYGIYDMIGNAMELVSDWYGKYDETSPSIDPAGPEFGVSRIVRGGDYCCHPDGTPKVLRTSWRGFTPPEDLLWGFRCAKSH
jgi:formylglycine-generating enzyme required for sulfatase activity